MLASMRGRSARSDQAGSTLVETASAEALETLYWDHSLHVFRYLRARVDSDDEAGELTAITFERAIRAHGRFRPQGGGERAWLLRIARNAAIDAARSRRHSIVSSDLIDAAPAAGASVERLAELRVLLADLPEEQRDALHLRYAGGLTAREIGVVIGKSESATQKLITRALSALREVYRDGR
jgi:RNA polymerase sigma-70 factor (ECF subfamily)